MLKKKKYLDIGDKKYHSLTNKTTLIRIIYKFYTQILMQNINYSV